MASTANPFEQQGKLLYSIKLSINATGKLLTATELPELTHDSPPSKWKIHADPKVFD
nr:hypothetical protein [Brevibacillus laterosporus]